MRAGLLKVSRGIHWYLKQATGEAKWDEHLERSRTEGVQPMTRRAFERHRSEHRENNQQSRCC
jgi:uncharacterized short protein YbdD (DUF466 family)